jgi:hypothetical protein
MSTKPENQFISGIHKHLDPTVYRMKNNNPYTGGVADCWYSGTKGDLWIEYKYIIIPKRPDTEITLGLSALQLEWLRNRHNEGRHVKVVAGATEGGVIFTKLDWEQTILAQNFRERLRTRKELAEYIKMKCAYI